jgi:hypothetical protein
MPKDFAPLAPINPTPPTGVLPLASVSHGTEYGNCYLIVGDNFVLGRGHCSPRFLCRFTPKADIHPGAKGNWPRD